jgi:hypothetical protein
LQHRKEDICLKKIKCWNQIERERERERER